MPLVYLQADGYIWNSNVTNVDKLRYVEKQIERYESPKNLSSSQKVYIAIYDIRDSSI